MFYPYRCCCSLFSVVFDTASVFPGSCEVPLEAADLAESLFLSNFQRGDGGILGGRGRFALFVVGFICLFFQELSFLVYLFVFQR